MLQKANSKFINDNAKLGFHRYGSAAAWCMRHAFYMIPYIWTEMASAMTAHKHADITLMHWQKLFKWCTRNMHSLTNLWDSQTITVILRRWYNNDSRVVFELFFSSRRCNKMVDEIYYLRNWNVRNRRSAKFKSSRM